MKRWQEIEGGAARRTTGRTFAACRSAVQSAGGFRAILLAVLGAATLLLSLGAAALAEAGSPAPAATSDALSRSSAATPSASSTPMPCGTNEHAFTFKNGGGEALFLADKAVEQSMQPIVRGFGRIPAGGQRRYCVPEGWNGRFWARTRCKFKQTYPNRKHCQRSKRCTDPGDVCYGGLCLPTCGGNNANIDCQTALNNSDAICLSPPSVGVCTVPNVCETGDCNGLLQCFGTWGNLDADYDAQSATLFESNLDTSSYVDYDVSLVSGYNVPIAVVPSDSSCTNAGCNSDLNPSCPASLQVLNANQAVVACGDPCDLCTGQSPPSGLTCGAPVPTPTPGTGPTPTASANIATYQEMYCAKGSNGVSMQSCNGASAICFSDTDCEPGLTCDMNDGDFAFSPNLPAGVGVCRKSLQVYPSCVGEPAGTACNQAGLYVDYTCNTETLDDTGICLPPQTAGLGDLVTPSTGGGSQVYTGCAGIFNATWVEAATQAGGGTTPYYETFKAACPNAYSFGFDDVSSNYSCNFTNGGNAVSFEITFNGTLSAVGPHHLSGGGRPKVPHRHHSQ